jgi:hypothetical protein
MALPRRVRDERLTLRRTGFPDIELFHAQESVYLNSFPTQGRFQVSPNAHFLAYSVPRSNALTVVRRDGTVAQFANFVNDRFRFSPDNKWLYVARDYDMKFGISRIDLASVKITSHEHLKNAVWLDFCADGLVVIEIVWESSQTIRRLSLMPWQGQPRVLAEVNDQVTRFAAAKAGSAIAYFDKGKVWAISNPGATPVLWGDLGAEVTNAEMSPDGRSLLVLTDKNAHLLQDGKLVASLGIPHAHTVWFSQDGNQFVVANETKIRWQRGEKSAVIEAEPKSPIRTARFAPMSPWVMIARGADAVRWNPEQGDAETIASADDGQEMLAADVFAGGLAIWTGSPWEIRKDGEPVL